MPDRSPQPLPPRTRLLHVGLTKTGTTALQHAASRRRSRLLRHGVRYPGDRYNHRQAAFALYRRDTRDAEPRPDAWDDLLTELAADQQRRVLISNEFIAGWDDDVAARFVEHLGPRTHVVITLRSYGALLPSIWQQYVKSGETIGFEPFLGAVLLGPGTEPLPPHLERHDQGAVVRRWAAIAGPERVIVVVGDKSHPTLITDAFENLLALPRGTLVDPAQKGFRTNRSLSADEAGLLLAVNKILASYDVDEADLVPILRRGAVARLLEECPAPRPEATLTLPPWAADAAAARGREFAAAIATSGVRVVGDLVELGRATATGSGRWTETETVPVEVAAQALVGALSAALGGGPNFGRPARSRPVRLPPRTQRVLHGLRKVPTRIRSRLQALVPD